MSVIDAKKLARDLWNTLTGDAASNDDLFKEVLTEVRTLQRETKTVAGQGASPKVDVTKTITRIVGKPLHCAAMSFVPICEVNMPVTVVFRIASIVTHPLNAHCVAFLAEHGLSLVKAPAGPDGGRRPTLIVQEGGDA